MAGKPVLNFSQHFDHNIWKIHAFSESPYLILEIRNQEELQVSFAAINIKTNKMEIEGFTLRESWWVSVAQVTGEDVIFYTFDADDNPRPKTYLGIKISDPDNVWEKEEFDIQNFTSNYQQKQNNEIEIPFHYTAGSDYFQTVAHFISSNFDYEIVRGADYFEKGDQIFISYFVEENASLANFLLIINKDKQMLLKEKLGDYNQGFADNTFFIINNKLIFVKGVTDFFMYELSL